MKNKIKKLLHPLKVIFFIISNECKGYKSYLCGKLKFGLCSFAYMDEGKKTLASIGGRKSKSALSTHMSSKLETPYTELINFVGSLNYNVLNETGM